MNIVSPANYLVIRKTALRKRVKKVDTYNHFAKERYRTAHGWMAAVPPSFCESFVLVPITLFRQAVSHIYPSLRSGFLIIK